MNTKYRAGGCVAPPLPTPAVTADPGSSYGKQSTGPGKAHVESQTEHGLHERSEKLPPAATAAGWRK